MAFCSHCGAQVDEGAAFCPSCGAPVGNGPRPTEPALDPNDVAQNRGISVLSYLGPLVFIPLFARKNSPYAQFHAKQGVTMFAFWVAAAILNSLLGLIRVTRVGILTGTSRSCAMESARLSPCLPSSALSMPRRGRQRSCPSSAGSIL